MEVREREREEGGGGEDQMEQKVVDCAVKLPPRTNENHFLGTHGIMARMSVGSFLHQMHTLSSVHS